MYIQKYTIQSQSQQDIKQKLQTYRDSLRTQTTLQDFSTLPIWKKSQTHEKRKENKQERQNSYIPLVIITNDTWYDIESSSPWYTHITASSINDSIFHVIFPSARRRIARDVYDRRPEEVLRGHEEDGEQEAGQGNAEAKGELSISLFAGVTLTLGANIVCVAQKLRIYSMYIHAGTGWGSNI